jgi:hypothetical protein
VQNRVATPDSVRNGAAAILRTRSILSRAVAHPTIVFDAVRVAAVEHGARFEPLIPSTARAFTGHELTQIKSIPWQAD